MEAIVVGVRELVAEEPLAGSLIEGGQALARARAGGELHRDSQRQAAEGDAHYRAEVVLAHTLELRGYAVTVHGRVDGLREGPGAPVIEEIKSALLASEAAGRARRRADHPHRLQLVLYQLLYFLDRHQAPEGCLIYLGLLEEERAELRLAFDEAAARRLLDGRLNAHLDRLEAARRQEARRAEQAAALAFPFPRPRSGQEEMMAAVEAALEGGESLLLSAPTGIGKTAAALYPAVRWALARRGRVFFLTAKTTQQAIALGTLRRMEGRGEPPRAGAIRAREKLCANDRVACHPTHCRYARDYYAKLAAGPALEELEALRAVDSEAFFRTGQAHELCPFELSLDFAAGADVVVCDYNYVFDPRVRLRRFIEEGAGPAVLVVDEAHNLPNRVREAYSPLLGERELEALIRRHEGRTHPLERRIEAAARRLKALVALHGEERPHGASEWEVVPQREALLACREEWEELLRAWLLEGLRDRAAIPAWGPDEPFPRLARALFFFLDLLARKLDDSTWFYRAAGETAGLRAVCLDPAPHIRPAWGRFHAVVAMSATLEPFDYYAGLLGLERDAPRLALPSPFPRALRRVIVAPQVDTRYKARQANFGPIAELIGALAGVQPGNLLVFFPSFVFLEAVRTRLPLEPGPAERVAGKRLLVQQPRMGEPEREELLAFLRREEDSHLLLAVQGGIFAEGVDYPGAMARGAIVVGPGLPMVEPVRARLAAYYEELLGSGFAHAYVYPGMQRVAQAAGRVIRSAEERGAIVLLGRRFAQAPYNRLFPRHWYDDDPAELIAEEPVAALKAFWAEAE